MSQQKSSHFKINHMRCSTNVLQYQYSIAQLGLLLKALKKKFIPGKVRAP